MSLSDALREALGAQAVSAPCPPTTDISAFPLGAPAAIVAPVDTAQVQAIVRIARAHGVPVVGVGKRTAYWGPLHLEGAIAVSTDRLRGRTLDDGVLSAGAGEPVRPLDGWLRRQGLRLPVHPDAFGETSLGAMVASGLTSGMGMGAGGIDRALTGLTVVTGTGEVLRTGTAHALGLSPFLRDGLPDTTGLFLGSEGTLGLITEVHLRVPAAGRMVRIDATLDHPAPILPAARAWLAAGAGDTVRILREVEPARGQQPATTPWSLTAWAVSPHSPDDAQRRADRLVEALHAAGARGLHVAPEDPSARSGAEPPDDPRWQGPIGSHDLFLEAMRLIGLDVNGPWERVDGLLRMADNQAHEVLALDPIMVRSALYLAPCFVNLGLHTTVRRDADDGACRAHQTRWLSALAAMPVVPYRPGHAWPPGVLDARDPGHTALMRAIKAALDPDGLLNPTHPLFAP